MPSADPEFFHTIQASWFRGFRRWDVAHYALGAVALLFSTLAAAKPVVLATMPSISEPLPWFVAFVAGLLAFLGPSEKASRYRAAWSPLSVALVRLEHGRGKIGDVIKAYEDGEFIIHQTPTQLHQHDHPRRHGAADSPGAPTPSPPTVPIQL